MSDYWLSNMAINSIPVGTGFGSGGISDPFLTLQEALNALASDNGDTIYINDGFYLLQLGSTGANLQGFDGLSLLGVSDYGATLISQSGATRMLWVRSDNVTTGRIRVVAGNNASRALDDASGPHNNLTIDGTYFSGGGSDVIIAVDACDNLTMKGGWVIEKNVTGGGDSMVLGGGANGGTYDVTEGKIINQDITSTAESGVTFKHLNGISGTTNFNCSDIIFEIDDTDISGGDYVCVYCSGANESDISNIVIDETNSTLTGFTSPVFIENNPEPCVSAHIHNITAKVADDPTGGNSRGIDVGGNASTANDNSISNILIEDCDMTGFSHGYLLGYNTGGVIRKCKSDLCLSGFVLKGTKNSNCEGNFARRSLQNYFLNKDGESDVFRSNTAKVEAGYGSTVFRTSDSDADCVTPFFYNNLIESDVAVVSMFDMAATTGISTTVKNNNIHSAVALPSSAFRHVNTNYSTLAAFEAAVSGVSENTEHDANLLPDYSLPSTSPCIGIGVKTWGNNPRLVGFDGEPLPDEQIDVGHIQSMHSINHPANSNFVPLDIT